ncbi:hypothetical protein AB9M62_25595 [Bacillales bacterium AN1005]
MKKKAFKKIFVTVFALTISFALFLPNESSAAELEKPSVTKVTSTNTVSPLFINDFRNVKKNVKKYESWSSYKRVSDNVITGKSGGAIRADDSVTFKTDVSGDIGGLNISVGASKSSAIGYTLNVPANSRVYMGYRVRYAVEEGTNQKIDIVTGKVMSSKKYVVKVPKYGEYKLLKF